MTKHEVHGYVPVKAVFDVECKDECKKICTDMGVEKCNAYSMCPKKSKCWIMKSDSDDKKEAHRYKGLEMNFGIESKDKCMDLCKSNNNCNAFSYYEKSNKCVFLEKKN